MAFLDVAAAEHRLGAGTAPDDQARRARRRTGDGAAAHHHVGLLRPRRDGHLHRRVARHGAQHLAAGGDAARGVRLPDRLDLDGTL